MAETNRPRVTAPIQTVTNCGRLDSDVALVGVLTPIHSEWCASQITISGTELLIGRGDPEDGVGLQIPDENVSRRHARIMRTGKDFLIEDIGSRNGTFVDGIPIRTCLLHDGDTIQLGKSLFYFDRLFQFAANGDDLHYQEARGLNLTDIATKSFAETPASEETMTLRFWGTRGSLPTPGDDTRKYGGNTTCLEVRFGDTLIVIDAGSGIRELSNSWVDEFAGEPIHANLLFTHLHWDHIQGFPFFGAAYAPANTIEIFGAERETGSTEDLLSGQMGGAYFPVPLSAMAANLQFHRTSARMTIGQINVSSFELPHAGGCLGYRIVGGGSVFVLLTDCELDRICSNHLELATNHFARRQFAPDMMQFAHDADLMVIDCQYDDDEYRQKSGWGHNSTAAVVDFCAQTHPKMVALFHHDPQSADAIVTERVGDVSDRLASQGSKDTLVFGARERLSLAVAESRRPAKLLK